MPKDHGIGASVARREVIRFLTGKGRFTADINLRGQAYAYFLRSDVAHGVINKIDTAAAFEMPGVLAIIKGVDFAAMGGNPVGWLIQSRSGEPMKEPKRPVLVDGKVRHVGDAYVIVVAECPEQVNDAASAIEANITELPANVDLAQAIANKEHWVHDEIENNVCFDWGWIEDNRAAVDAAFASAPHITTLELLNNTLIPKALDPHASIADNEAGTQDYKLYTTTQNPHLSRLLIAAFVTGIPENKLIVIAPDVGGAGGSKIVHYGEKAAVLAASKAINQPVKWVAERTELVLSDAQGRDHIAKIQLALTKDGTFLALRRQTMANVGAYLSNFASVAPTFLHGALMTPDQFPYQSPVVLMYDTGIYRATLDKMIDLGDVAGFDQRAAASKGKGKLRGIGYSTRIEACGIAPSNLVGMFGARVDLFDAATVRVNAMGSISVMTGAHSYGQGHETVFAQIVADQLGKPESLVDIVHGDTSKTSFGMGSYGSRSLSGAGTAIVKAVDKIMAKGKKIAAHMLEGTEGGIVFADGKFSVTGTEKAKTFGEIAFSADVPHNYPLETLETGLEETAFYDAANFIYPAGAYACEVEVDPCTGMVEVMSFTCADDFANVMIPMIVDGQMHGGAGQGIGQSMFENSTYDENGQLLSGSNMDYAMPRAINVPFYTVDHSCKTPYTHNPFGVKGCGEARAIGSPPAVVNAVIDALHRGGFDHVKHIDMPVSPSRVWSAIQA